MNTKDKVITILGGHQYGRTKLMLEAVQEWCVLHPGKKALLARTASPSQILTYDAGSKVFIYSPVKVPLDPTVAIVAECKLWLDKLACVPALASSFGRFAVSGPLQAYDAAPLQAYNVDPGGTA